MNFNQVTVVGFIGRSPELKTARSGKPMLKFSVATNKFWTDSNNERQEKAQWHQVVAYGDGFAKLAERIASGSHVFVQGELVGRDYERVITVPNGKKTIEHKIQQHVVEIKASIIRVLDRSSNNESDPIEVETDESETEAP